MVLWYLCNCGARGSQGRLSPAGENEEGGLHPVEVDLQNIFQWILVKACSLVEYLNSRSVS